MFSLSVFYTHSKITEPNCGTKIVLEIEIFFFFFIRHKIKHNQFYIRNYNLMYYYKNECSVDIDLKRKKKQTNYRADLDAAVFSVMVYNSRARFIG